MRNSTKAAALAGVATLALMSAGTAAQAQQTINLSIGAGHTESALWVATIRDFFVPTVSERVAAETDYQINWTTGWGGTICRLRECLDAVEVGLLDIADVASVFEASRLQPYNFPFFVPFGSPDPRITMQAIEMVIEETPELLEHLEQYNQIYLGAGVLSDYGLLSAFEWDDPADLSGRRFAAAGPNVPWLEGSGIVPVSSNLNEAYTALQTGVYDGRLQVPDAVVSFSLYEVARQWTIMNFNSATSALLTINRERFDSLPEEVQTIIVEVGAEWARHNAQATWEAQVAAFDGMRERGMVVKEVSDELKAEWVARIDNLPAIRAAEIEANSNVPGDIVYRYFEAQRSLGHEFPRDWAAERE